MIDPVLEANYTRWLPQDRAANILDLGCGDGHVLRFLSEKGYRNILGVDRDAKSLSGAGTLPGVTTEQANVDIEYLRRHRGKFKLIVARQMIYYYDRRDVLELMEALRDALTEDGSLLVEFFNGALLSANLTQFKDPFIRTAYTEHAMRRLIAASGLHEWHTGAEMRTIRGLRSRIYQCARTLWVQALCIAYILERGYDEELPRIFTKSIISVAGRQPLAIAK